MSDAYLFKRLQVLKAGVSQTINDIQASRADLPPQVLGKLCDTEADLSEALERLDQAAANRGCTHPVLRVIGERWQCKRCGGFVTSEELEQAHR